MRFLILETYYPEFIHYIYQKYLGLDEKSYLEQLQAIYDVGFARADFLPLNLHKLGYEAEQVIVNVAPLQKRWAIEHGLRLPSIPSNNLLSHLQYTSQRIYKGIGQRLGFTSFRVSSRLEEMIVANQVKTFNPDIIFNCDIVHFTPKFLWQIKEKKRFLIGECSCPIPFNIDFTPYDLIVSAAPHYVERFRQAGVRAELLRLAFEPSILCRLDSSREQEEVIFIGSIGKNFKKRVEFLESIRRQVILRCWGPGWDSLTAESPLKGYFYPPLWGYDMYRQFQQAKIVLNVHIDQANNVAGNMRLFEATGVGTLLITDWKQNLHEMFEPGKEIVSCRSAEECIERISYYLAHEEKRKAIAQAGQARTLREHTYYHRMQELVSIINPLLSKKNISKRV